MFYFAKHSWTGSIGSQDTHITKSLLRNQREAGAWYLWDQTVSPKTSCHNNSPRFLQRVAIYKTLLHPLPHVILLTTKYLGWGLTSTSLSIEQTTFVYCCVADNMVSSGNTRMECKSKSLSSRAPSVVGEWVSTWVISVPCHKCSNGVHSDWLCTSRLRALPSELGLGVCQAEEEWEYSWQNSVCAEAHRHKGLGFLECRVHWLGIGWKVDGKWQKVRQKKVGGQIIKCQFAMLAGRKP